ncbi:unnamed protein product [Lota lota]
MNEMLTGTQDQWVKDTTMSVKQVDGWMVVEMPEETGKVREDWKEGPDYQNIPDSQRTAARVEDNNIVLLPRCLPRSPSVGSDSAKVIHSATGSERP